MQHFAFDLKYDVLGEKTAAREILLAAVLFCAPWARSIG